MKLYQIIMQDEYENLHHLGFYKSLDDALSDVNEWLNMYEINPLKRNELIEYPSSFGYTFDRELDDQDGNSIFVRGFIFEDFESEMKGITSS